MRPIDILEDIFTNQISVLNISVPTNIVTPDEARIVCEQNNFDVHLVREYVGGDLRLYIHKTGQIRNLFDHEVISGNTPILDVLEMLVFCPQAFVKEKRYVTQIVSLSDLDSVPIRIWLFGMISLLEVELRNRIKATVVEWKQCLTKERMEYAEELYRNKISRNEEVELLDCVQIVDLAKIISKSWEYFQPYFQNYNCLGFMDKLKKLNKLRDELAHAQKFSIDWPEIYKLMNFTRACLE